MAQHDYVIDNSTGANVRADINNVLQAIATNNSGSSDPSTTVASQFFADTNAGILKLRNTSNNGYVNLFTLAGGVDVDAASNFNEDVTFTGASANIVFDKSDSCLEFADNAKAKFGSGDDTHIYHNGSHSYISHRGTGDLILEPKEGENGTVLKTDGAVELYFDNSKKIETASFGTNFLDDFGANDNIKLLLGNASDLQIYHDGSHSYIQDSGTGVLHIATSDLQVVNAGLTEFMLKGVPDGNVELYFDNSLKMETTATGTKTHGALSVADGSATNNRISVGNGGDLKIFHTNPNTFIQDTSSRLVISGNIINIRDTDGDDMAEFTENGSAKLYHNGSQKLNTSSSGVTVTGTVTETSDIALKSDIQPLTNSLEKIQQITGYKYKLDNASINSMGVIAQDVEKVFPDLVHGDEGSKTLQYSGLIGVLVEAVKDLSAKVATLEAA